MPAEMKYRREIDGLRALAVLPVILFHGGFTLFAGGYVGVDVFFVISGYLITSLIISEKQQGKFTLRGFYERRVRRILPGLFVVMLACLPLAWFWMLPSEMKAFSKSLIAVAAFVSNIMFWREGGYFETPGALKPLFHTWSLAVEEQYYVLFPLFLLLIWRFGRRWISVIFAVLAISSLAAAVWASRNHPQGGFFLLPTRGWELLIGASLALYFLGASETTVAARETASPVNEAGGTMGLALIAYAVIAFDRNVPYPSLYTLVPTLGTALIILCANPRTYIGKLLNTPILVGVGLISYSAYLWHQPLFAYARLRHDGALSTPLALALAFAAIACAYVSWRYIERPFRNRAQFDRTAIFAAAASMTLLFLLIGVIGYSTDGFAYRYSKEDRGLAALDLFEAGSYVEKRFIDLEVRPFDDSGRKKLFVIGDSFAQDIVNAAYEGGLTDRLQVSTHWIPTRCGNLFLETGVDSHLEEARQAICKDAGWYNRKTVRSLMSEADAIWIASNWTDWEVGLLPQSVRNLQSIFRGSVVIFGTKNFGRFTISNLLHIYAADRPMVRNPMIDSYIRRNTLMKTLLPAANFLDVSALLCGSVNTCPLFTSDGQLISFDGLHLTKDGAAYLGQKLSALELMPPPGSSNARP
jgi:peptidoglycan/LPS O-acetylase OafA/YrhL